MKTKLMITILAAIFLAVGVASAAGQPSCTFTAVDVTGSEDFTTTFTGTAYNMTAPFSYHWDFGDGTGADKTSVSAVSPITHTYLNPGKYTVSLAVYDIGIPTTMWYKTEKPDYITVTNKPPSDVTINAVPNHGNAPLSVTFIGSAIGVDVTYIWDFGDGNTGEGKNPIHLFAEKGTYTITLTATNDGGSDTAMANIIVTPPAPVANFEASSATTGAKPFAVQFNDTSVYDGTILTWSWDFGDGATSSVQNPLHVYTNAGTYNVHLMVDTISGNSEKPRNGYIRVLDTPEVCPEPTPVPPVKADTVGIFRKATGFWYLDTNGDHAYDFSARFGNRFDTPVVGDMNGDGITDYGIFRQATGYWYFDTNKNGGIDITVPGVGGAGSKPMIGDYNADGKEDVAVFDEATGYWDVDTNLDGFEDMHFRYGGVGDVPVIGNWK